MSKKVHMKVGGAPEGFDARLVAKEVEKGLPVLHIARDDRRLAAMRDALGFFAPNMPVIVFPAWDCLPYDRVSPNANISAARTSTLAALAAGFPGPFVLLSTVNAVTQYIPARETIRGASFAARVGERVNEDKLRDFLVRMGFSKAPTVTEPGDYAIRGGIVDIYPPGHEAPVRLDFFGNELDGLRQFDPATQRTTDTLATLELAPVSEVILDEAAITRFRRNYRAEFGAAGTDDPLYEAVSAGRKHAGMEHWLPFFHEKLETIFDYAPDAVITTDDRIAAARLARWEAIVDQYDNRRESSTGGRSGASVYKPAPPNRLYLDDGAYTGALSRRRVLGFGALPVAPGPGVIDAGGRIGRNFAPERAREDISLFAALSAHIADRRAEGHVVVASYSEGARERLTGLIADEGLSAATPIADWRDVPDHADGEKGGVFLAVWPLEAGFEVEALTVISEQDVLGDRLIRAPRKRRRADNFLTEHQTLSPGDLVVHVDHGVGRYMGLETVTAMGAPHECLALEYAGADRLLLPVENIELLSRFGQEDGLLDKLGGGGWLARKAKLKKRIREIADRLIRVAAERVLREAPVLEPPADAWEAFAARFPYQETEDQLSAIGDVLEDLRRGVPMDRLICGDVGFGKTEVAMRAALVAALSGVQVAMVVPTTLLARQHAKDFDERFRGFPVNVRRLSRFVPGKEAADTRKGIAEGVVDMVVGTHALLAKSIKFHNLGLLIIDEEQHFGVSHKERMKEMRSNIHVLTMTASPIPRTLQLSLAGVRDLSIISTPPVDRLSIRTYVGDFDPITIREALLREKYRGGQSFFVVPRIKDLPEIEEFLIGQVPEINFVAAHGQMGAGELDDKMNAFYDGKYDTLLATTIVESGIDIPAANTMIVHRADMFGLAQLYQIRGRVGRSKVRAYAYLTTKPRAKLTPAAEKRLRVLGSLDALGAGLSLASQDLDIRGAGNLVGEEQSGNFRQVGYELYQSMLEEAIAKIKSGGFEDVPDGGGDWSPRINLGVPVLIPEHYVPDLDARLGLYRRLSGLSGKVELEGFAAELIDRFGPLPKEVNMLLLIMRVKALCRRARIGRFDGGPKGAMVRFHDDKFPNPAGLVEFLKAQGGLAKIKDNKIIIRRDWKRGGDRIKGAFAIARDLAAKAKAPVMAK